MKNTDVLMKGKVEMKTVSKHTTATAGIATVKPVPKNISKGNEENKKETDLKTTKDKIKASSSIATTTITVKVVPKIAKIVREGKEEGTKAVTKTSNSGIVKIRKPLATKN